MSSSYFAPICKTFEDQKQNASVCDSVLQQFIRVTQTDPNSLSDMAVDPYLNRFIQIVFTIVTRDRLPAPTEGVVPPLIIQTLQFLTVLSFNHPDLQSAIAANTPLDALPDIFFGANFKNDKIVDPQSSHLLTPLRFLLSISASHSLNISSTSALHILFTSLFSLFDVQGLASYAAAVVSGFIHNCPAAASYVRSLPNYVTLKTEFVSLLSANDHNVVIAAMSCISGLYQTGTDAPTLVQLAFHAIRTPPSIPFSAALCCWTILDLIQQCALSPHHIAEIVDAILQSSGMRAMHLLSMLTEFHRIGINCRNVLIQKNLIFPLIGYLIKNPYDYVSVAGVQYVQMLFEDQETISLGTDIPKLFTAALQTIVVSQTSTTLLKIESMLLLLRIMLKCNESENQILTILNSNQNQIFVGFQRHIEANHSFVALNYFLFIHAALTIQKQWSSQLLHIIAESQFCALIVHVLTHSTNRVILRDAVYASYVINSGLTGVKLQKDSSPLIDSMVSGFLVMNKENEKQKQLTIEQYESYNCSMIQKFRIVQNEKEKQLRELNDLSLMKEKSDKLIRTQEDNLHAANLEIQNLQNILRNKRKKLQNLKANFLEISKENASLKIELKHNEDLNKDLDKSVGVLKSKVRNYKEIEDTLRGEVTTRNKLLSQVEKLELELANAKKDLELWTSTANNEKKGRVNAEEKLLTVSSQLNEMTIRLHEQETLTNENGKQASKFEALYKKKAERLSTSEESNRDLRQQVDELQQQIFDLAKTTKAQKKYISQLQTQVSELETSKRDHTTLYQFIHKITENKGIITDDYSDTPES